MKKSFTRIGVSIWNSIPLSVKTLHYSLLLTREKVCLPTVAFLFLLFRWFIFVAVLFCFTGDL